MPRGRGAPRRRRIAAIPCGNDRFFVKVGRLRQIASVVKRVQVCGFGPSTVRIRPPKLVGTPFSAEQIFREPKYPTRRLSLVRPNQGRKVVLFQTSQDQRFLAGCWY